MDYEAYKQKQLDAEYIYKGPARMPASSWQGSLFKALFMGGCGMLMVTYLGVIPAFLIMLSIIWGTK